MCFSCDAEWQESECVIAAALKQRTSELGWTSITNTVKSSEVGD